MSQLDKSLIKDATKALFKFENKKNEDKESLIDDFSKVVLAQIQLKKSIPNPVQKPVRVKIPNTIFDPEENEHTVCLFCKSEDKAAIEKYLEEHPIKGLKKVISLDEVKKLYKEFKSKKTLVNNYTHFLTHTSIARQLYNNLGKTFGDKNSFPIQISFNKPADIEKEFNKMLNGSTFMHLSGNNITIPFGNLSQTVDEVTENIVEGLHFAIEKFPNSYKDVHSIHLKTKDSASLPIFARNPENEIVSHIKNEKKKAEKKAEKKTDAAPAATTPAPVKRKNNEEKVETNKKIKK